MSQTPRRNQRQNMAMAGPSAPAETGTPDREEYVKIARMSGTSWHERLSALDAAFLYMEDRNAHMHVGGLCVFAGPPPSHAELL